ncbi:hypothetical protein BDB00DRAFT_920999, partial [Zychaea mexicana]|uniref:uncharacterized protein n=1 Tax=Zychaea mexicana TaxID=64656 RepID=UPI0022FEAA39
LGEAPGHFVVGVVGQQGVGKSTTSGIDILVSPEHTVLLDTEPLLSASILDETLRTGSTEGLHPEVWLEIDTAIIKLLRRAEMMKFNIPDFPLIPPANFGQTQVDTSYYADIVFACNKCRDWEFQWRKYEDMQLILHETFSDSKLKTSGLVSLGKVLPAFEGVGNTENLFFLPYSPDDAVPKKEHDIWNVYDRSTSGIESFDTLMQALREQVVAAPRRQGKKGQVSEKEWYRNAIKIHELIRKSEYIAEFIKTAMKMVQK